MGTLLNQFSLIWLLLLPHVVLSSVAKEKPICAFVGSDVTAPIANEVKELLSSFGIVFTSEPEACCAIDSDSKRSSLYKAALCFGSSPATNSIIDTFEVLANGDEAYAVKSKIVDKFLYIVSFGSPRRGNHLSIPQGRGSTYASFALLKELGFGFLHPLEVLIPKDLLLSPTLDILTAPHYPQRGIHIHTEHPLELTEVLNGWGHGSYEDEEGFEAMLVDWKKAVRWCAANRVNAVEWVLLASDDWGTWANSTNRKKRLQKVTAIAKSFDVAVGLDAPFGETQQKAWNMVQGAKTPTEQKQRIRSHLDWCIEAGFEYFSSELGTTEFTHSSSEDNLSWENEAGEYLLQKYNRTIMVRAHCSVGQKAKGYPDPWNPNEPINFNMLTYYADPIVGVTPHTVQFYAFNDPAPTYGNTNFSYMLEFLELELGKRPVFYYPEAAYWINFDISVPLFLPVYIHRRLQDLRDISAAEQRKGTRMDGQIHFSSGWEWSYWLHDLSMAQSAWDPALNEKSPSQAAAVLLRGVLKPLGSLSLVGDLVDWIVEVMETELDVLIHGIVDGRRPRDINKLSGQAYLAGWDTWSEVMSLFSGLTQPQRAALSPLLAFLEKQPHYCKEIRPLLQSMNCTMWKLLAGLDATLEKHSNEIIGAPTEGYIQEFRDSMYLTAVRSSVVAGSYDIARWPECGEDRMTREEIIAETEQLLKQALEVVEKRETHYRVDPERIAGWKPSPVVYKFRYLWTVRNLFFSWRDLLRAKHINNPFSAAASPCFMNDVNPIVDITGKDSLAKYMEAAKKLLKFVPGLHDFADCLAAPVEEPTIPPKSL